MKLVHEVESQKKEDGEEKKRAPRLPLAEKIIAGATLVAVTLAVPTCTFVSNGLDVPDADQQDAADGSPDADIDGGHDADVDADDGGPDADMGDGGHDADLDGGPDADVDDGGVDGGPDADLDGGPDADVDDGGVDGGPDADADGGPVACMGTFVDSYYGLVSLGAPRSVGGYLFDYMGPSAGGVFLDITCGGMMRYDNSDFPIGIATTLDVALDGKRLILTPHSNNATSVTITIDVQNL